MNWWPQFFTQRRQFMPRRLCSVRRQAIEAPGWTSACSRVDVFLLTGEPARSLEPGQDDVESPRCQPGNAHQLEAVAKQIRSVKDGRYRRILPEWVDDYIRRVAEDQAA